MLLRLKPKSMESSYITNKYPDVHVVHSISFICVLERTELTVQSVKQLQCANSCTQTEKVTPTTTVKASLLLLQTSSEVTTFLLTRQTDEAAAVRTLIRGAHRLVVDVEMKATAWQRDSNTHIKLCSLGFMRRRSQGQSPGTKKEITTRVRF